MTKGLCIGKATSLDNNKELYSRSFNECFLMTEPTDFIRIDHTDSNTNYIFKVVLYHSSLKFRKAHYSLVFTARRRGEGSFRHYGVNIQTSEAYLAS